MKKLIIAAIIIAIAATTTVGCATTIGRFVTNVSSGTPGTLNIERCELRRNAWTSEWDVSECETSVVGVIAAPTAR